MKTESKLMILIFIIVLYFSMLLFSGDNSSCNIEANAAQLFLIDDKKRVAQKFNTLDVLYKVPVSCNSFSMRPGLDCRDILYTEIISHDKELIEGHIYVYVSDGTTIVHRLVKCLDDQCNRSIFKGDNNYVADDIVNKNQIYAKVYGVEYI